MDLHTPTLFQVLVVASAAMAIAIAFIGRAGHQDLHAWALALALQSGAYLLFGLRGQVPDVWSIVVANGLLAAALATFTLGLLRFQQRPAPRWLIWLPVGVVALGMSLLLDDFRSRLLLGGSIFGVQSLCIAGLLWQRRRRTRGSGQYILFSGALLLGLAILLRVVSTLLGEASTRSVLDSNPLQATTFLGTLLCTLLMTIGLLMMTQERAEQALRNSEQRYRQLVEAANEGICVLEGGQLRFVNARMQQLLGHPERELLGKTLLQFVHADDRQAMLELQTRSLRGEADGLRIELRTIGHPARVCWLELSSRPVDWQGQAAVLILVSDITERRMKHEEIRDLAYHDSLTRLPNRRLFLEHLQHAQAATKRQARHAAVIYLDLDNFKALNDSWGHHVGDLLLIEVAQRIQRTLREVDTVARFGGDEFVVLLGDLSSERGVSVEQVRRIADKLVASLAAPYHLRAQPVGAAPGAGVDIEHRCTASLGVALFSGDDPPPDRLLEIADAAMYRAKQAGRNRYVLAGDTPAPPPGST